ncbi:MAG: protein kinase [bacterium]|nr:protein kinase [bacterium]
MWRGAANSEFDPRCTDCGEPLSGPLPDELDGLAPGEAVGRFRVVATLGHGGMGTIYRARDPKLGRDVALKFPRTGTARERRRLEREARAAAALDHPNLGTLYEVGVHRGRPFLVLAYYEGETLAARLKKGPLPWRSAVTIARQLLDGLAAIHGADLVHRDLKPSNILLPASGGIKLLDFGLAWRPDLSRLTEEGLAVGTLAYMAPEQLRGEVVDARSDLWALGVILHEMLTGTLPFAGADRGGMVGAARPPDTVAHVRAAALRVVKRCLERDPARRPASAEEVKAELEAEVGIEGDRVGEGIHQRLRGGPLAPSLLLELDELRRLAPQLPGARLLEAQLRRRHREARRLLAVDLLRNGAAEQAAELLRELAAEDPEDVGMFVNLGIALALLDRPEESVATLRKARVLAPASPVVALHLADSLELAGRGAEARRLYAGLVGESLSMRGTADAGSWKELGVRARAAAQLGRPVEAVERLRAAWRLAPDNAELAFAAALVYCLVGDLTSAQVHAAEALRGGFAPRWFQLPLVQAPTTRAGHAGKGPVSRKRPPSPRDDRVPEFAGAATPVRPQSQAGQIGLRVFPPRLEAETRGMVMSPRRDKPDLGRRVRRRRQRRRRPCQERPASGRATPARVVSPPWHGACFPLSNDRLHIRVVFVN